MGCVAVVCLCSSLLLFVLLFVFLLVLSLFYLVYDYMTCLLVVRVYVAYLFFFGSFDGLRCHIDHRESDKT